MDVLKRILRHPVLWLTAFLLLGGGVGVAWGSWRNLCNRCPSIAQIHTFEPRQATRVFSHDGELIAELGVQRRTPVRLEDLPAYVPQAFIAVEDQRFYEHRGVDPRGVARAVYGLATGQSARMGGGSTITQQLTRNMWDDDQISFERSIQRKLKEMQVALAMEDVYEKDQILEAYINQVNYGRGLWGIQTASRAFFGKDATEVDVAEAALLAAVVNLPGRYNPFTHPENARSRRSLVLDRMADQGFLTRVEADRWQAEPLPTERPDGTTGVAPYFEEWVRQILDDRFGGQVYTAGLRVHTTLDVEMQRAAEEAMRDGWERIESNARFRHPRWQEYADREETFENGITPYLQGMFVALDPATGAVRAMIGGRDFRHSKFNRATQSRRQPGSAFKPLVYAAAIRSDIPASQIVVDAPVVLPQQGSDEWRPRNFDGEFHGPMTMREGLYRSVNMVAIKIGWEMVGIETVRQTAQRMGIQTEIEPYPSTTIGAAEVIPIQLAEAYTGFATLGTRVRPFPIARVETSEGEVLWEPNPERTQVLDSLEARIVVSMLEDVVNRGTAWNAIRSPAGAGISPDSLSVGGKTGTTNDFTNVWFMGFTPNLLTGVWFGFDRPRTIYPNATGGQAAAPVAARFLRDVYFGGGEGESGGESTPLLARPGPWPIPSGLVVRQVDERTGKLASRWCPEERAYTEYFLPGTEPTEPCDEDAPSFFRRLPGR